MRRSYASDRRRRIRLFESLAQPDAASGLMEADDENEMTATERFLTACGGAPPLQLSVSGSAPEDCRTCTFDRPYLLVGRSPGCDVELPDPQVSFRHAYLQVISGRVLCVDLASRTGIHFSTGPADCRWMEPEESANIGPYSLQLRPRMEEGTGEPASAGIALPNPSFPLPEVTLEILNGRGMARGSRLWPIQREVSLAGWSRFCHLRLRHQRVSRVHASLVCTPDGVWLIDLLGRNGTRVNGEPITSHRLECGDRLEIGPFRLAVHYGPVESDHEMHAFSAWTTPGCSSKRLPDPSPSAQVEASVPPASYESSPPAESDDAPSAVRPNGTGLSEQFVLQLVNQFTAMHQQSMDQCREMMLLVMQGMMSLHQQQQDLIREELARVRQIDREFRELQQELLRRGTAPPPQSRLWLPELVSPSPPPDETTEPLEADAPESDRLPSPKPAAASPKETAETPHASDSCRNEATSAADGTRQEPPSETAHSDSGRPQQEQQEPRNPNIHIELHRRLAQLERERNSRWRKIMNFFSGATTGD
jgi:pSer/pThr/pTyr-binding forkhead associated (FHA) protein